MRVFEAEAGAQRDHGVIVSEPGTKAYDGPSVTNNIEQIAAEVVMRFALPSSRTTVIEHWPPAAMQPRMPSELPETFDLVTFEREDPEARLVAPGHWILELGEPDWKQLDRETVEALIGHPLEDAQAGRQEPT